MKIISFSCILDSILFILLLAPKDELDRLNNLQQNRSDNCKLSYTTFWMKCNKACNRPNQLQSYIKEKALCSQLCVCIVHPLLYSGISQSVGSYDINDHLYLSEVYHRIVLNNTVWERIKINCGKKQVVSWWIYNDHCLNICWTKE